MSPKLKHESSGTDEFALGPLKLAGQLPSWLKLLIVLLVAVAAAAWFYVERIDTPERRLISEQQANAMMRREMAEYQKHAGKEPEPNLVLVEGDPVTGKGRITVGMYPDECLLSKRIMPDGSERSLLIMGFERNIDAPPNFSSLFYRLEAYVFPTVMAQTNCDGRQHAGPVSDPREVGRQGEWVLYQYWFGDGCSYVQPYNWYYRIWGQMRWVVCRH